MIKERREWVNQFREGHNGKIPDDLEEFKNRFNVEAPLSPEEEAAKKAEEEEAASKKKKKKGEKKKAKKKKSKKDDDDGKPAATQIYVSEIT